MQIEFQTKLTDNDLESYIVIPYEEGARMEQFIMQTPFFRIEQGMLKQLGKDRTKVMLATDGGKWVTLALLQVEKRPDRVRAMEEAFAGLGRELEQDCTVLLDALHLEGISEQLLVETAVRAVLKGAYRFRKEALMSLTPGQVYTARETLTDEKDGLKLRFVKQTGQEQKMEQAVQKGQIYGHSINLARTVSNLPNNYLHTEDFADYARDLAKAYGLSCKVLGNRELQKLHAGGILSVNAGSSQEAKLICMEYIGNPQKSKTAVIGKGVMFDAGGYHLKSMTGMDGMKFDMCGAANAAAVIEIIARLQSDANILVVIPAVENVISPDATKMGDVITTMSGRTVEVDNTDAEGRLILCDALTYAQKQGADSLIDIATLTYSCQAALGDEISGIFANQDAYYEAFLAQARQMGDKIWRLPLDSMYHKMITSSEVADLRNYAIGKQAGASVAACFLEEFVEADIPWIHLDVVGSAVCRGENPAIVKGATGILIQTIAAFVEHETWRL